MPPSPPASGLESQKKITVCFICQGQRGRRGLPGKSPKGAIKFGDTAANCTLGIAGTVQYSTSKKTLLLCDGSAWLPVFTAGKGHTAHNPGLHCLDILNSGQFQIINTSFYLVT